MFVNYCVFIVITVWVLHVDVYDLYYAVMYYVVMLYVLYCVCCGYCMCMICIMLDVLDVMDPRKNSHASASANGVSIMKERKERKKWVILAITTAKQVLLRHCKKDCPLPMKSGPLLWLNWLAMRESHTLLQTDWTNMSAHGAHLVETYNSRQ